MSSIMEESVSWIYKIVITLIITVVAVWIVGSTITNDVNTREVQKQLFIARVLYSHDSIWYEKEETVYPGIVDYENFTTGDFTEKFQYPDKYMGAKLTLIEEKEQPTDVKTLYIERETYEFYRNQVSNNIRNGGRAEVHVYPVLIQKTTEQANGYLILEIAYPERT